MRAQEKLTVQAQLQQGGEKKEVGPNGGGTAYCLSYVWGAISGPKIESVYPIYVLSPLAVDKLEK